MFKTGGALDAARLITAPKHKSAANKIMNNLRKGLLNLQTAVSPSIPRSDHTDRTQYNILISYSQQESLRAHRLPARCASNYEASKISRRPRTTSFQDALEMDNRVSGLTAAASTINGFNLLVGTV
jgi:hypothetical protein